jgi:hypothetical protein
MVNYDKRRSGQKLGGAVGSKVGEGLLLLLLLLLPHRLIVVMG